MANILHTGFSGTTSENIKHAILDIVSSTKAKREFKNYLMKMSLTIISNGLNSSANNEINVRPNKKVYDYAMQR